MLHLSCLQLYDDRSGKDMTLLWPGFENKLTRHLIVLFCVCIFASAVKAQYIGYLVFCDNNYGNFWIEIYCHVHITMKACFMKQVQQVFIIVSNWCTGYRFFLK